MPEGIEVEIYRQAADPIVGHQITSVDCPDEWFLKEGATAEHVSDAVVGQRVETTRRIGKLMLVDLSNGVTVGLRFGMTGRLLVDDSGPIDELEYGPKATKDEWVRFRLSFDNKRQLFLHDPRRLGGVILDPDESKLGDDMFSITQERLQERVLVGTVALKARLLDQKRVAGIGNLICDETLWQSGIRPDRAANSLTPTEQSTLHTTLLQTVETLFKQGGSHTGELQSERHRAGHCPADGTELSREKIGGRTTYYCDVHQK